MLEQGHFIFACSYFTNENESDLQCYNGKKYISGNRRKYQPKDASHVMCVGVAGNSLVLIVRATPRKKKQGVRGGESGVDEDFSP